MNKTDKTPDWTDVSNVTNGALSGLRVLDLSRVLAGPWAGQSLADLGADVIKVEHPIRGDDTRHMGPPNVETNSGDVLSAYYLCANRNKRSIAIDISSPAGSNLVRELATHSDVIIENFKVGKLKEYGLDYECIKEVNPKIIYCSITGFGQDGPYANRGGYDFLIQGMGGLMSVVGPPTGSPGSGPTKVGVPIIDLFTGLYATCSILACINYRNKTGKGQYIDCSLLDSAVAILANQGMNWQIGGDVPGPMGNGHPNVVPYSSYPVSDGEIIIAVGNDRQFQKLCTVLGSPELAVDPRYATNAARVANREELDKQLCELLSGVMRSSVIENFEKAGVPGGPIHRIDEVFHDKQVKSREMVEWHSYQDGTSIPLVRFPVKFSEKLASIRNTPPKLGEDSYEILSDILDLSEEDIRCLMASGAVTSQMKKDK